VDHSPVERPSGHRLQGVVLVAISAAGFATIGLFARVAAARGASTLSVLALRFLLAGALLGLVMRHRCLPWPRGRELAGLVLLGALGYTGQSFCFFSALHHLTVGLTVLLLYLHPALVLLASAVLGRQRLTLRKASLAAASFAGILLTVSNDLAGTPVGLAFGIGAALIYTNYILVGEHLTPRTGVIPAATVIVLSAAVMFSLGTLAEGVRWPGTIGGWLAVAGIAMLGTSLATVTFFAGVQRIGAGDAATLSTLEPVVALVLAFVFLGEQLGAVQLAGALLVIASAALLGRSG
jgi:drug/metabolite transporter (DMT)-like permease